MKLQAFVNEYLELPANLAMNIQVYQNAVWCYSDNELSVNTDQNQDDLWNGNGNTYSFDVRYAVESEDGWVVFYDADNGCGSRDTIILKIDERVE